MLSPRRPFYRSPVVWLLLVTFAAEFFLFDHFGSRRVTGIYPRWNDQIQYLSECYTGYEYARGHGFLPGLWHTLINPSAQGTLHDFFALIEFELVGPSRSAALALNMAALIAWQLALFIAVRRRSSSDGLAWLAAMLPLALRGPWENVPGSAYDFRLDHLAMCALGITSAVALATDGFRRRGTSTLFGLATGITLLTRFITGTYFVVIFLASAGMASFRAPRRDRLLNLLLAAVVATAIALPIFWLNREWVWNYYYIGHYVGPESAIRNQNFGLGRSLQYVFGWLWERHLGGFFAVFAAAVAAALGIHRLIRLRSRTVAAPGPRFSSPTFAGDAIRHGAIFLLSPALVLTLHPQKSEVVLGALVPGVLLIVVGIWTKIAGEASTTEPSPSEPLATSEGRRPFVPLWLSGLAAISALVFFGLRQTATLENAEAMAQFRQVNTLADYVVKEAESARLPVIRVAVDHITDALDAQVLRVVCYERHHVWKDWDMKLPTGIAEPDAALVQQRIAESDFVFLTDDDATYAGFPYDRKLASLRPQLRTWCDAHLVAVSHFNFRDHPVTLYQRRELTPRP